jgi:hypothetical protein
MNVGDILFGFSDRISRAKYWVSILACFAIVLEGIDYVSIASAQLAPNQLSSSSGASSGQNRSDVITNQRSPFGRDSPYRRATAEEIDQMGECNLDCHRQLLNKNEICTDLSKQNRASDTACLSAALDEAQRCTANCVSASGLIRLCRNVDKKDCVWGVRK